MYWIEHLTRMISKHFQFKYLNEFYKNGKTEKINHIHIRNWIIFKTPSSIISGKKALCTSTLILFNISNITKPTIYCLIPPNQHLFYYNFSYIYIIRLLESFTKLEINTKSFFILESSWLTKIYLKNFSEITGIRYPWEIVGAKYRRYLHFLVLLLKKFLH